MSEYKLPEHAVELIGEPAFCWWSDFGLSLPKWTKLHPESAVLAAYEAGKAENINFRYENEELKNNITICEVVYAEKLAAAQAENERLREALMRCENWFESQAKVVSKGCGSSFELMQLRDEQDAIQETLASKSSQDALREHDAKLVAEFVYKFKRHVGGDGEFWLHELEDYADKIRKGEWK